jgi:hypothetical protein
MASSFATNALQVADTVAVAIVEALGIDLIDDGFLPPRTFRMLVLLIARSASPARRTTGAVCSLDVPGTWSPH